MNTIRAWTFFWVLFTLTLGVAFLSHANAADSYEHHSLNFAYRGNLEITIDGEALDPLDQEVRVLSFQMEAPGGDPLPLFAVTVSWDGNGEYTLEVGDYDDTDYDLSFMVEDPDTGDSEAWELQPGSIVLLKLGLMELVSSEGGSDGDTAWGSVEYQVLDESFAHRLEQEEALTIHAVRGDRLPSTGQAVPEFDTDSDKETEVNVTESPAPTVPGGTVAPTGGNPSVSSDDPNSGIPGATLGGGGRLLSCHFQPGTREGASPQDWCLFLAAGLLTVWVYRRRFAG